MAKKQLRTLALLLAALAFGSILLVACARPGTGTANTGGSGSGSSAPAATKAPSCSAGDTVKTSAGNFEQTCITLSKGGTLKVVQDAGSAFHELDYGQWNGSSAQPASAPAGAPAMKDLKISTPSTSIGPFTTAGTFHIYCIVHPGMNLTVVVK